MVQTAYAQFDCLEFADVSGKFHTIRQCSLTNREHLRDSYSTLIHYWYELFSDPMDELNAREVYKRVEILWDRPDDRFRYLCNKCLHLGGIKPEWIGMGAIVELLFRQTRSFLIEDPEEEIKPGLLIQLNFPVRETNGNGEGAGYEELMAAIARLTGNITEAIKLAREHPAGELLKIIEARVEQEKRSTPQGAEATHRKKNRDLAKKIAKQMAAKQ